MSKNSKDSPIVPLNLIFDQEKSKTILSIAEINRFISGLLSIEETFKLFWCDIVLKNKKNNNHQYDFWKQYLKLGLIKDCTLALSNKIHSSIRKDKKPYFWQYSILKEDKYSPNGEALLIISFDKFVVTEWKNIGKCNIWSKKNSFAPKLHQGIYERKSMMNYPDYVQQHYFSREGRWQKNLQIWLDDKLK